jgi:hypothetical protein
MLHWKELVKLSEAELSRLDLALVNLTCASELPGAEKIDFAHCLRTLDQWAECVRQETERLISRFQEKPDEYDNSLAYFQMLVLATVLQRQCGVRYNAEKISADASFTTEDTFVHGIIQGNGGTCGSLPVLYAAVGRRLGYPLKLGWCPTRVATLPADL